MSDWYEGIDVEVRDVVRLLRDNGFNTCWSSGQRLEVQSIADAPSDVDRLDELMRDTGYGAFSIALTLDVCDDERHLLLSLVLPQEQRPTIPLPPKLTSGAKLGEPFAPKQAVVRRYCGVEQKGRRFLARVGKNGKKISLGTFDTPEEAAAAYQKAVKERDNKGRASEWTPRFSESDPQEFGFA